MANLTSPKMKTVVLSPESLEAMRERVRQMEALPNFTRRDGSWYVGKEFSLIHKTGVHVTYNLHDDGDVQSVIYKQTGALHMPGGGTNPDCRIIFFSIVYSTKKGRTF